MSRLPLVTIDSDILVYAAQAGDPRQEVALEMLQLAAGGRWRKDTSPTGTHCCSPRPRRRVAGRRFRSTWGYGAALGLIRVVPAFAGQGMNPAARALL
jgi:hypothetical protein